jgi:hypothetical protein
LADGVEERGEFRAKRDERFDELGDVRDGIAR